MQLLTNYPIIAKCCSIKDYDAKQGRDVMTADVPNAFVQYKVNQINGERIVMKIRGALVDILVDLDPKLYADNVVYYGKSKILYVLILKGLYGMLIAPLLYYRRFVKDIKKIGFVLNPYDPCTANRIVTGLQHTIVWHVDDMKSSHLNKEVNDNFEMVRENLWRRRNRKSESS